MPFLAPVLDNRKFEDLLAEARQRIQRYNPDWTDFNDSDPGMTLVQLFAWLTELMLYQFNQVPDRSYIKFLQLVGLQLRPAQPARVHLTFSPVDGAEVDSVRELTQITAQPQGGGSPLIFETEEGLDLIRVPFTDLQVFDGSSFAVVTSANVPGGTQFSPFGLRPAIGSALYIGFSATTPPARPRMFPPEMRLRIFLGEATLAGGAQNAGDANNPPPSPVDLEWEYRSAAAPKHWKPLNLFLDESRGFTREGYIKLEGPKDIALSVEGRITEPRYWLRARITGGGYARRRAPKLDFVRFNTIPALNLSTVREEYLGVSDGTPSQTFTLARKPVNVASIVLSIQSSARQSEVWTQVDDILGALPDAPNYTADPNLGQIKFGDGTNGRIPPAGWTIVAKQYRFGGGGGGNVPACTVTGKPASINGIQSVTNDRPAIGGRDQQPIDELKNLAPKQIRSRNRAVTIEDFAYLAGQAGGIAKATAVPLMHPDYPEVEVPGSITIAIVPDSDSLAPIPSADQLRSVARYLNEYRLLTTELFVTGPDYLEIRVETLVAAQPYASFDSVTQDVIAALEFYLDPLARLPDKRTLSDATLQAAGLEGWKFGESLHPTNLFSVILGVEGVAWVKSMRVFAGGNPHELSKAIIIPPNGLFSSGNHQVTVIST